MNEEDDTEVHSNEGDRCSESSSVSESEQSNDLKDSYLLIPYGFVPRAGYKPKSKSKEVTGVTYNSRSRQFIILDSRGVSAWSFNSVVNSVSRLLDYPSYQFNLIRLLLHSKKFNVYFALSKDYSLKIFNPNFHQVFSVVSDMNSVLCMVFNCVTDELITGGTAGVKFWSFGKIQTKEQSLIKDSRPMANYGLILRCEHPTMGGSWVKDIILEELTQTLYCLSERNVVAYDMQGNFLFMLKSAHQGLVTSCVFSRFSNFVVTSGTDCMVNVWSSNGGCIHSFHCHSKMVTKLLIHPEAPSLVITSSEDGTVKIFSLDIMEEIYSHTVFPEGVQWMNLITSDLLYCASDKELQIFSINHLANFWATIRCPLKSLSLSGSYSKTQRVIAMADDNSTRLFSMTSRPLSTVLPPPSITTAQHDELSVRAQAYTPLYGLMYLLVNNKEIWVYYTKTNPANRVEVWDLSDIRNVNSQVTQGNDYTRARSCSPFSEIYRPSTASERVPCRPYTSPSLFSSGKTVDGISCLSLEFLNSPIVLNTNEGEACPDITHFLVAGLQDGRLLFLNPFLASLLYLQLQATKGAVVSVKHDAAHNSLLLNTITLREFTIQIRSLPHLELDHEVRVGNDLTSFVRMDGTVLSGHESGRLKLHYVTPRGKNAIEEEISCDVARKSNAKKLSKDHLDTVLTVDANCDLQLFCSSSKDGCIKVWDSNKVLLREIVMDASLTAVCFLNSAGDLIAGFKNHIFSISHDKAHLSFYSQKTNPGNNFGMFETESDVYEDPRIRFEFKKTCPPEPISMENYLVPFANMSINLKRYLSVNPSSTEFQDDAASDHCETESELSSMFSVAPTEVYSSQNGTPLSRSRSSSLLSNWELPNLGSSPVSSPPRTPPPVMTPLIESESETEESNAVPEVTVPRKESKDDLCSLKYKRLQKEQKTVSPENAMPVVARRNRIGLSEVKIDSGRIRLKANIHRDKRDENTRNVPGITEDDPEFSVNIQQPLPINQVRRLPKAIQKKTKGPADKFNRRVKNRRRLEYSKPKNPGLIQVEIVMENEDGEDTSKLNVQKLSEKNLVEQSSEGKKPDQKITIPSSNGKTIEWKALHVVTTRERDGKHRLKNTSVSKLLDQPNSDRKNEHETGERGVGNTKDEVDLGITKAVDKPPPLLNNPLSTGTKEEDGVFRTNELEPVEQQLREKAASFQHTVVVYNENSNAQSQLTADTNSEGSDESNIQNEEEFVQSEEKRTSSSSTHQSREKDKENSTAKTVSFMVSENIEGVGNSSKDPPISRPHSHLTVVDKLGRRSTSPVNSFSKVISVLDLPFVEDQDSQQLHPSSALKIYTVAKTCRKSCVGKPIVPRPRIKRCSFVKHNKTEEPFPVTDEELKKILTNRSEFPEARKTETAKEKKKDREKKDLVKWCLDALSEKGKRPIFSPKPRRSRRSVNLVKSQGKAEYCKTDGDDFVSRTKNSDNEYGKDDCDQDQKPNSEAWKPERILVGGKHGTWFVEKFGGCLRSREVLCSNEEQVKELSHSMPHVGLYGDGWQDRFLERTKSLREKRMARERKVLERRRDEEEALEEKRRSILGVNERLVVERTIDEPLASRGLKISEKEGHSKSRRSCFENFKKSSMIAQPYRLGKFNSGQEEDTGGITSLRLDPECRYLADGVLDILPRPKSAPSIPSKCHKYILVASESDNLRDKPVLTPLEESLMFERFPKSNLRPRTRSPHASELRRPQSVAKIKTVQMSCE